MPNYHLQRTSDLVRVVVPGPQGPIGPEGLSAYEVWLGQGNIGTASDYLASITAAVRYEHTQSVLSDEWTITHNLGRHPAIHIEDSAGNVVFGSVRHVDNLHAVVSFSSPFTGLAVCS